MSAEQMLQRPTLPGKVDGIVGMYPLELQCRECGSVYTGERPNIAADILLAGYIFHTCEGRDGIRRCPECHAAVIRECPNTGRHR